LGTASVVALLPLIVQNPLLLHVWIMLLFAVALGSAWNIIGGYTGQHSLGHAAYFGIGGYSVLLSLEYWHLNLGIGFGVATLSAILLALLIGAITFRLQGPYFVLASISVTEIIRLAALECKQVTRGAEGILLTEIPRIQAFGCQIPFRGKLPFFYAALGLAALVVLANWAIEHSKLGYYFQAIREDQDAARSLGIHLTLYKNIALALSAIFTAWAGGIWAMYVKFLDPNLAFGIDVSIQMLLTVIIGGIGTIFGPAVGAVVLVLLSETLRNPKWLVAVGLVTDDSAYVSFAQRHLANAHVLVYGVLVVVVVLFAPEGVSSTARRLARKIRARAIIESNP
jgi:branched-chain amino acid transport system permease protein